VADSEIQRSVTVQGKGSVSVTPDTAGAAVGASITVRSVDDARQQVAQRMNAVIQTLRDSGIPDEDIDTTSYNVNVNRDHQVPARPVTGYTVSHIVHFTVTPLDKIGPILSAVVDAGANELRHLEFSSSDLTEATAQARAKAMADAESRARQYAQLSNLQLGAPISIREGREEVDITVQHSSYLAEARMDSADIPAGQQDIEVQVTVIFELTRPDES
jgi:uncharacterized protein YggE